MFLVVKLETGHLALKTEAMQRRRAVCDLCGSTGAQNERLLKVTDIFDIDHSAEERI